MPANDDSARKASLAELAQAVGRALAAGRSQDEIIKGLAAHGWPEESAKKFVDNIARTQQQGRDAQPTASAPPPVAPRAGTSGPAAMGVPACIACGRQDETLRIVGYPFVVSLVFITFRRGFTGLWCKKHRNLYSILASLITATVGWIGIPFGLIFTPMTLFTLAKGGNQPPEQNSAMLRALADHKLNAGDAAGAARSLEASLRFSDDEATRDRLFQIRTEHGLIEHPAEGCQQELLVFGRVLLGAIGIGALVGALDYAITVIFGILTAGGASLFIDILSWTPLIAAAFIGGTLLAQIIEGALAEIKCCSLMPAVSLGVLAAILAVTASSRAAQ